MELNMNLETISTNVRKMDEYIKAAYVPDQQNE